MPRYEFADQAEFDLETIMDYTLDRWGKTQAEDYLEGLEKLAQHLADVSCRPIHAQRILSEFGGNGLFLFPSITRRSSRECLY